MLDPILWGAVMRRVVALLAFLVLLAVSPARADDPAPSMNRAEWRGDLDFLYTQMQAIHPALHHRTDKATMDAAVAGLRRDIPQMSWPIDAPVSVVTSVFTTKNAMIGVASTHVIGGPYGAVLRKTASTTRLATTQSITSAASRRPHPAVRGSGGDGRREAAVRDTGRGYRPAGPTPAAPAT